MSKSFDGGFDFLLAAGLQTDQSLMDLVELATLATSSNILDQVTIDQDGSGRAQVADGGIGADQVADSSLPYTKMTGSAPGTISVDLQTDTANGLNIFPLPVSPGGVIAGLQTNSSVISGDWVIGHAVVHGYSPNHSLSIKASGVSFAVSWSPLVREQDPSTADEHSFVMTSYFKVSSTGALALNVQASATGSGNYGACYISAFRVRIAT